MILYVVLITMTIALGDGALLIIRDGTLLAIRDYLLIPLLLKPINFHKALPFSGSQSQGYTEVSGTVFSLDTRTPMMQVPTVPYKYRGCLSI